ncbi:hypothetical protein TcBrA4_0080490 [Trypanosoma cruzi]|nr:hypothetical protein TcBrA4_0080490 [Trypanosoma cruzi]
MSTKEVDEQMLNVQNKNSSYFIEWIPNNIKSPSATSRPRASRWPSPCRQQHLHPGDVSPRGRAVHGDVPPPRRSCTGITGEGMDEMEFTEAESQHERLLSEYQQYQDATIEEEGEFDEEEQY